MDLSKLETGSFQDSLAGWRKEAAGEPLPFHIFSSSTSSLLSTALTLQHDGVQGHSQNSFEGLAFSSSKTNEGKQRMFCVNMINGRLYLS